MKTITGKVTETLTVEKEVTVEVPHNATPDEIEEAIRDKAYETTIADGTGWEAVNTEDVDVTYEGQDDEDEDDDEDKA